MDPPRGQAADRSHLMAARALLDRLPPGRQSTDQLALFAALWALAHAWHVIGNPDVAPAWAQALVGFGVVLVLLRPGAVAPLGILALATVVDAWMEAPRLSNHWLLVTFVDVAILLAVAVGIARRRPWDRLDLANRALPAARLSLLGFYAFAAFAKLNADFFDRSVSCAVVFFQESTDSIGLSGLQFGGAPWAEWTAIIATAVIELSIPVLLLVRRTRHFGVVLALVFHLLLALDRTHQFFDFSAALFALFLLFLPPSSAVWVAERIGSIRARLALRHSELPFVTQFLLVGIVALGLGIVVLERIEYAEGIQVGWAPFLLYGVVVIGATIEYLRQERPVPQQRLLPHHPMFLVVPALVILNGLTPYLELKTAYGWNMYANLRTVDGDSNHFVVRETLPLTDEQDQLVEIVRTDDAWLRWYRANGYLLPMRTLRVRLAEHPDTRLTYRLDGQTVRLRRASDDPELVEPVPIWQEKLLLFRAVDATAPPDRCVVSFGPIG